MHAPIYGNPIALERDKRQEEANTATPPTRSQSVADWSAPLRRCIPDHRASTTVPTSTTRISRRRRTPGGGGGGGGSTTTIGYFSSQRTPVLTTRPIIPGQASPVIPTQPLAGGGARGAPNRPPVTFGGGGGKTPGPRNHELFLIQRLAVCEKTILTLRPRS
jgi:hypothetical protein